MKNTLWFVVGLAAVTTYILATRSRTSAKAAPVDELAHKLQDAWADHHTVV